MSTNSECMFFEAEPDKWFYALEQQYGFKGGDWTEDAYVAGPFPTVDAAIEHLHDNHANPGGHSEIPFGAEPLSPRMHKLVERAEKPGPKRRW